jgi:hypothetical protein
MRLLLITILLREVRKSKRLRMISLSILKSKISAMRRLSMTKTLFLTVLMGKSSISRRIREEGVD